MRYIEMLEPTTFRPLFEMLLYRGDSTYIDNFDIGKTDRFALFGPGIYLTDSHAIAADYTTKASGQVVFQGENIKSEKDLLSLYIVEIMKKKLDWKTEQEKIFNKWQQELQDRRKDLYDKEKDHNVAYEETQRIAKEMKELLNAERTEKRKELLKKAKAIFKKEAPGLRTVKDTKGEWKLVRAGRTAYVTEFDVPESYMAKVFHAEEPIPNNVLDAMRELFTEKFGKDQKLDMRNSNCEFCTFDEWLRAYNTIGIDYAWSDDDARIFKGHGNPTFDMLRNGTHYGLSWFYEPANIEKFRDTMQRLGYVGIEYYGGKRAGSYVRGGGGVEHRAYCFWNDKEINKFRAGTENVASADAEVDTKKAGSVRASHLSTP